MRDFPDHDPSATGAASGAVLDLLVVGAGIAGLNALHVAADLLPKGARVALVDRRPEPGGMWNDTYPYVRLHQPHPAFTVGNLRWDWSKPPQYLARRDEVIGHLQHCLQETSRRLRIDTHFGHECLSHAEVEGPRAGVSVTLRGPDGQDRTLIAKRIIHAAGFDVPSLAPLTLSSRAVASVTPETLDPEGTDPVYIVGGGKTAMDTAHLLIRSNPDRKIYMFEGSGTAFVNRGLTLPTGIARNWSGHMVLPNLRDVALRFDGSNADAVAAYYKRRFAVTLRGGGGAKFFFGYLSEEEADLISDGLERLIPDYLDDVVDGPDGPEAITRGSGRIAVPEGAIFVNCTGHIARHDRPYQPFLSPGGRVLTITARSAIYFLTSVSSYFATHLFLRDELQAAGLWELDLDALRRIDGKLFHIVTVTHSYLNTLLLMEALPLSVFDRCGLDLDRWFPVHRRMLALIEAKLHKRADRAHCERVLAGVADRHGIHCGPLPDPT